MNSSQEYRGLQDKEADVDADADRLPSKRRSLWFWGVVLLVITCLIIVIVLIVVNAAPDNNDSGSSSNSNSNSNSKHYTLSTKLGKMKGNILKGESLYNGDSSTNNSWIYEFIGVRYAESPIGDNRFRPAIIANESWNDTTYDATDYGATCPQVIDDIVTAILLGTVDEDCLFLNIWTPYIPENNKTTTDDNLLPVMLYIHGGSFISGAGRAYNGTQLVKEGNYEVVYVSINYRLGILGFLETSEIYQEGTNGAYGYNWPSYGGMNGIYDQLQAIRWVKQQISSFGGDPNKITIFGESAGGLSVCGLLITDLINEDESLIYQAIVESGPCAGPWGPLDFDTALSLNEYVLESGTTLGNLNNLTKLRELSYDTLINDVQGTSITNGYWAPSVDKHFFTENATTLYANRDKINANRVIWGFNSQDGLAGWPYYNGDHPNNVTEYENLLKEYLMSDENDTTGAELIDDIMNTYYPISEFYNNASIAWYGINSDLCITCPMFEMATNLQNKYENEGNNNNFKQFVYEFEGSYSPYLAPHFAEVIWVFDLGAQWASYFHMIFNQSLSESMISAWNNFAHLTNSDDTFDFTITKYNGVESQTFEWIEYGMTKDDNKSVIVFANTIKNQVNYEESYRHGACYWWKENVEKSVRKQMCANSGF